jgi:uncharacterized protein YggE
MAVSHLRVLWFPTFIASLMGCIALAGCTPPSADHDGGIHVSGTGAVETVPDMGTVVMHVRRDGDDPAALERELSAIVAEVLALTQRLGIAETDVTATVLRIQPRYQPGKGNELSDGVTATRSVSVTVRELNRFPQLLEQALAIGINNVDPIRLTSSIRRDLEAEALALAMADAAALADRVADGFSVTRGPVMDVQVHGGSPRMAMQEMRAAPGATMAPGVIRIEQSVQATFAIVP